MRGKLILHFDFFFILKVMANCPHTIGVEFGTRIIEVAGQKIKLQVWDTGKWCCGFTKCFQLAIAIFDSIEQLVKRDSEQ